MRDNNMFDTTSTRRTFVLPKDAPALCGLKKKKKLTTKSLLFIMMSDRVHTNDEIFKREKEKKRRVAAENYPSCVHVSLASEGVVNFCFTRKARPEERECSTMVRSCTICSPFRKLLRRSVLDWMLNRELRNGGSLSPNQNNNNNNNNHHDDVHHSHFLSPVFTITITQKQNEEHLLSCFP